MVDIEQLRRVILESRSDIEAFSLVPRNIRLPDFCTVVTGIRRSGKSCLLYRKIQEMLASGRTWNDILYVNFEDERLIGLAEVQDLNKILEVHAELSGTQAKPVVFLDEIQNVAGWEKFARRLADSKYRVYITGSNAKMLSGEIMTTLGGRYVETRVAPYSFAEYLCARGFGFSENDLHITARRGLLSGLFQEYLVWGGFPEIAESPARRPYLTALYQKIFLFDIAERNRIKMPQALRMVYRKLIESIGRPVSTNRLSGLIRAAGTALSNTTCAQYLDFARDACLLLRVSSLSASFSDREGFPKYYVADNGIVSLMHPDPRSALLENLVAVSLLNRFRSDDLDEAVWFYSDANAEVDFCVPSAQLAIQVAVSVSSGAARERECRALVRYRKRFPDARCIILTENESDHLSVDGVAIDVIPAWEFFLQASAN